MEHVMSTLIQFPLDLPDVNVLKTELTAAGHLVIAVESTLEGTRCRRCGREIQEPHGHDRPLRLRHLPVLERPVYIEIRPKRYRCPYCSDHPTTTQRCSWYEPNSPHTRAFEQQVLRSLINSTVSDVSRKLGLSAEAIEGILDRQVAQSLDWASLDALGVLGVDEIALRKGHRDFITIVSARSVKGELTVLAVLADRCKETVKQFLASIPERLQATVTQVCTDMYDGYINAVREVLPRARVVIDRFHVAKTYRACADELRKQELKRLKAELPNEEYAALKGTLWLFRRPWAALNPEEREKLDRLFAHAPALKAAHTLCEVLTLIFDEPVSKTRARAYLDAWASLVKDSGLTCFACFDSFLTTLESRLDEITNYFLDRQTSGFVEGLNNKIKVLKRRCYGLFSPGHLFQRLHLDLAGYRLFGCP
jgi:transposase